MFLLLFFGDWHKGSRKVTISGGIFTETSGPFQKVKS